jgi:hypothetical protein
MFIDLRRRENLEAPEKRNISTFGEHFAPPELKHFLAFAPINIRPLCGQEQQAKKGVESVHSSRKKDLLMCVNANEVLREIKVIRFGGLAFPK